MALLNKFGRMEYPDGDVYEGDFQRGRRHGIGTYFKAESSTRYEGQWEDDAMHGEGVFYYALEKYVGQWQNNERHGEGLFYYENGSRYQGQWRFDKRYGQGEMNYSSGGVYIGQWSNDVREGQGKMIYADESVYEGCWVDDLRQGKGENVYQLKNGKTSEYSGEFYYDLPHGTGVLNSSEEDSIYSGDFVRGYKEGKGKIETPTEIFEGVWHENKRVEGVRILKSKDESDWVEYNDNVMVRRQPYVQEDGIKA